MNILVGRSTNLSFKLTTQLCFVFITLSWGLYLLGSQGALHQIVWPTIGSAKSATQILHLEEANWSIATTNGEARGAKLRASLWMYRNVSTGNDSEEDLALHKNDLLPSKRLHEEFLAGRATVFLLRIQKAASSALDEMFSTHHNTEECQPNMRVLEWKDENVCNQLFNLLHYAQYDPAACGGLTGWDDPAWRTLDCIPWIFSYAYEMSYRRLPELVQARLQRTFQSLRLVSGHFMYGIHSIGHRGTFAYVTTLRDPVSRIVSWWNWSIQMGNQHVMLPGYSAFDRFVLDADLAFGGFQKSDHMTRVLCNRGTGIRGSASERPLIDDTPLNMLTELTREHYECALHNLQQFAFVFIAENISDVEPLTPLVSRFFNMKIIVGPLNGSESNPTSVDERVGMVVRSKLSKATTSKLMELNTWDALLYDKARTLHEVSVARLIEWGHNNRLASA